MNIEFVAIKEYNGEHKQVLMVNDKPVCITKGIKRASMLSAYLQGYNVSISDGQIKKTLDKVIVENL